MKHTRTLNRFQVYISQKAKNRVTVITAQTGAKLVLPSSSRGLKAATGSTPPRRETCRNDQIGGALPVQEGPFSQLCSWKWKIGACDRTGEACPCVSPNSDLTAPEQYPRKSQECRRHEAAL